MVTTAISRRTVLILGRSEIPKEISSLSEFSTEIYTHAIAFSLLLVDKNLKIATEFPKDISSRFRYCQTISDTVKNKGYTGEIGYNTILYPSVHDVRKLMLWLLDEIPRTEGVDDTEINADFMLRKRLTTSLLNAKKEQWTPYLCRQKGTTETFRAVPVVIPSKSTSPDVLAYYAKYSPSVVSQCSSRNVLQCSLLELERKKIIKEELRDSNALSTVAAEEDFVKKCKEYRESLVRRAFNGVKVVKKEHFDLDRMVQQIEEGAFYGKGSRFTHHADFAFEKKEQKAVVQEEKSHETEIEELSGRLDGLKASLSKEETLASALRVMAQQIEEVVGREMEKKPVLEKEYNLWKKIVEMLPEAEENISKLRQKAKEQLAKIMSLSSDWEKIRPDAIQELRELRSKDEENELFIQARKENVAELKQEMRELMIKIRQSDEVIEKLSEEYAKVANLATHSVYTKRIYEAIRNVKKQKVDIDKVLEDTYALRKETDSQGDILERTYAELDEIVFKKANDGDQASKTIYRSLVDIHSHFKDILNAIETTGTLESEMRDLESQIVMMQRKKTGESLAQLRKDLHALKSQNTALESRL